MADANSRDLVGDSGRPTKLRASCDGCNESKVRCSQRKPRCARCESRDMVCVYGLSRRVHKTAPRVGESQSFSPDDNHPNGFSPLDLSLIETEQPLEMTEGTRTGSPERVRYSQDADFFPGFDNYLQATNFVDVPETIDFANSEAGIMSAMAAFGVPSHIMGQNGNSVTRCETTFSPLAGEKTSRIGSPHQNCDCTSRVYRQLLSTPSLLQGNSSPLDVQLSQLQNAMRLSEDAIKCICSSKDELNIVVISVLVGRIIQGFEATLSIASLQTEPPLESDNSWVHSSTAETSSTTDKLPFQHGGNLPRRFSWGALQIEDDEESNLRQHLWLMQFRKLERLLNQFSTLIQQLKNSQNCNNWSHFAACECIHMWLERKAQAVKETYLKRPA